MAKRQQWILGTMVIWLHHTPLCLNETMFNVAPYRPFFTPFPNTLFFLSLLLPWFSHPSSWPLITQLVCIDQYAVLLSYITYFVP